MWRVKFGKKWKNKTCFQLVLNPFLSGDAAKRPNIQFPVTDLSIKHEDFICRIDLNMNIGFVNTENN